MVFSSIFTIFAKRANMKQAIINKPREFYATPNIDLGERSLKILTACPDNKCEFE